MKQDVWYIARASGITAWAMLAASVLWGLLLSTRLFSNKPKPAWTLAMHRFLGVLSITFVAVHLGALVADTYVHYGIAELFIPMKTTWHPLATAFGIVALYLLTAIELTSLLMKRLPYGAWLKIHRLSLVLFILASIHFVAAGTDARGHERVQLTVLSAVVVAVFAWLVRVLSPRAAVNRARRLEAAARAAAEGAAEARAVPAPVHPHPAAPDPTPRPVAVAPRPIPAPRSAPARSVGVASSSVTVPVGHPKPRTANATRAKVTGRAKPRGSR